MISILIEGVLRVIDCIMTRFAFGVHIVWLIAQLVADVCSTLTYGIILEFASMYRTKSFHGRIRYHRINDTFYF
jgi:hypothetical protein